jgi:FtsH-binding integral membrane protein
MPFCLKPLTKSLAISILEMTSSSFIGITYLHILAGLGITAISAERPLTSNPIAFIIEAILSLIILWILLPMEPGPLKYALAITFAVLIGQILTKFVKKLEDKKILTEVLLTVAGIFLAMTAVGFYDNQNILGFGVYLFAALLGLVIARVLLIFGLFGGASTESVSSINTGLSWFGTVLFTIYVAYDTQRLKADARLKKKDYVNSSMGLFLDAINLFENVGDILE